MRRYPIDFIVSTYGVRHVRETMRSVDIQPKERVMPNYAISEVTGERTQWNTDMSSLPEYLLVRVRRSTDHRQMIGFRSDDRFVVLHGSITGHVNVGSLSMFNAWSEFSGELTITNKKR